MFATSGRAQLACEKRLRLLAPAFVVALAEAPDPGLTPGASGPELEEDA
jgi:hypothetical protein